MVTVEVIPWGPVKRKGPPLTVAEQPCPIEDDEWIRKNPDTLVHEITTSLPKHDHKPLPTPPPYHPWFQFPSSNILSWLSTPFRRRRAPFRLMDLPPELREIIYAMAIAPEPITIPVTTYEMPPTPAEPPLLLVSRKVRHEALPIFYGNMTFQLTGLSMPYFYDTSFRAFLLWLGEQDPDVPGCVKLRLIEDTYTDTHLPKLAQFYVERYSANDVKRVREMVKKLKRRRVKLENIKVEQSHDGGVYWERRKKLWTDAVARSMTVQRCPDCGKRIL